MALGHTFYHKNIRTMVVMFGNLFNNINLREFDSTGKEIKRYKVPISYGPKQKFLARLDAGANLQTEAITLPRMAFEMDTLSYDTERKQNSLNKITKTDTNGSLVFTYAPVPYNFEFSLYVMVKNAEDGTQIMEQILPYFTPHFNVTIIEQKELDIRRDIPIILNSVNQEDIYEGDFDTRRSIVWTLTFTVKSHLYGPVRNGQLVTSATIDISNVNPDNSSTGVTALSATGTLDAPTAVASGDFGFSEAKTQLDEI